MNTILLQPTDVLFFRDGRPMEGSLAGHSAAWPLPDVINHAFHAALHRAGLDQEVHKHRPGKSGQIFSEDREREGRIFGSLLTAGPFPVRENGKRTWFFPRPADAQKQASSSVTLHPIRSLDSGGDNLWMGSSLPEPLRYAVGNAAPPRKEASPENWMSTEAFEAYLQTQEGMENAVHYVADKEIAEREAQIGIAIDPETQTTGQGEAKGKIYTAHYLRLREEMRLGVFAKAEDKACKDKEHGNELIAALLNGNPCSVIVGGQQRVCTAIREKAQGRLPIPLGKIRDFHSLELNGRRRWLVKWVLLTPAVWPEIAGQPDRGIDPHPGGWLPNWVDPGAGEVRLKSGNTERGEREHRDAWRQRVRQLPFIPAQLVAAIVPKPLVVTGWALPNGLDRADGGAKSVHLAVPAGAVYYFEADSAEAAADLAASLNWHGQTHGVEIKNRRSALLGEKGYGLGVCGTWNFFFRT